MPSIEPGNTGIYRFDNILVEPAAHRLERNGRPLPVEPKAYTLLLILLRHAGEMVSKDTLLDSIWGHRHVTCGVLNRLVSQLRHTLGDSSVRPHYIATVHSLGFRFIGEVHYTLSAEDNTTDPSSMASLAQLPAQAQALDGNSEAGQPPHHRRFIDGDPYLNLIDLPKCLGQLANWAALLPPGDTQRQAILSVLRLEYVRLRGSGVATPSLTYRGAVLAALSGDRQTAIAHLRQAIDEGFRDTLALQHDLAWRVLANDTDFQRQQQRLDAQLAAPSAH